MKEIFKQATSDQEAQSKFSNTLPAGKGDNMVGTNNNITQENDEDICVPGQVMGSLHNFLAKTEKIRKGKLDEKLSRDGYCDKEKQLIIYTRIIACEIFELIVDFPEEMYDDPRNVLGHPVYQKIEQYLNFWEKMYREQTCNIKHPKDSEGIKGAFINLGTKQMFTFVED